MNLAPDQAQSLLDGGYISQDTYSRMMEKVAPPYPQPSPTPGPMTPTPGPLPAPAIPTPTPWQSYGATGSWEPAPHPAAPEPTPQPEDPQISVRDAILDLMEPVESSGNPDAVSPKGAKGAYQLMDATGQEYARRLGIAEYNPFDRTQSRQIAGAYLDDLLAKYNGDKELAVAAYNTGETNLDKALAIAPTKDWAGVSSVLPKVTGEASAETLAYVPKVLGYNSQAGAAGVKATEPMSMTDQIDKGLALQSKAAEQAAQAGIHQAQAESAYLQRAQVERDKMAAEALAKKQALEQKLADVETVRNNLVEAYQKAPEIDRNRVWAKQETWQKVLTVIGAALVGGLLGPEKGMAMIDNIVKADIDEQRFNLALRKDRADQANTLYGQLLKETGDASTAYSEARVAALELAAKRVSEYGNGYKSDILQAKKDEVVGSLMMKAVELKNQTAEAVARQQAAQAAAAKDNPTIQGQLTRGVLDGAYPVSMLPKDARERAVVKAGKVIGLAKDSQEASKLTEGMATYDELKTSIDGLIAMRKDKGGEVYNPEYEAKLKPIISNVKVKLKDMAKLGALNAQDYTLLDGMIPPVDDIMSFHLMARAAGEDPIKTQLDSLASQLNNSVSASMQMRLVEKAPGVFTPSELSQVIQPGRTK